MVNTCFVNSPSLRYQLQVFNGTWSWWEATRNWLLLTVLQHNMKLVFQGQIYSWIIYRKTSVLHQDSAGPQIGKVSFTLSENPKPRLLEFYHWLLVLIERCGLWKNISTVSIIGLKAGEAPLAVFAHHCLPGIYIVT